MSRWAKIVLAVVGGPLLLVALAGIIGDIREAHSKRSEAPSSSSRTAPVQARPVEPPLANVTVHAYSLLKDPYSHRGQMVTLNVAERPLMYEGSAIRYVDIGGGDPRMGIELGMMGLRLNRMMSEDVALYDILGMDADGNSTSRMLGQLVVVLPAGRRDLDFGRYWEVEPLGVVEGTNGFGAPIQVPEVRFWRYADERYRRTPNAQ